jgi:autotransporter-associated beta strand protein
VIRNNTTGTGILALVKTGAGNQTLIGTNIFTGGTRIDDGTLTLGHATDTLSNTGAINVNGGTLALGTNTDTVGVVTLTSGNITGSGTASQGVLTGTSYDVRSGSVSAKLAGTGVALTKTTSGTVTLSAVNTYTGATNVNAGTLLINGSTSSTSLVTVNNGGTLGGTGTIGGSVTLNDGAFLSPGASIESLATGSNIWNGGSTFVFEFSTDGSSGTAGSQWDLLAITGNLDLTGASISNPINFDLVTMEDAANSGLLGTWNPNANALWAGFVTTTGGITNFAANLFNIDITGFQNTLNGSFSIAQNGNNLDLVYTAVPEPRAALLGGLGLLALLRRRR